MQHISAIDIDKSMPNTVISFGVCSKGSDAVVEVSDLALVISDLVLVVGHLILQPLHPLHYFVFILQEAQTCLIPIGHPLSGRSGFRAFHGFP